MASDKPVIHARDHLPGHADPIPGLDDLFAAVPYAPDPDYGMYDTNDVTVASDNQGDPDWVHTSGSAILNLSSPAAPTIITAGVYAITGSMNEFTGWSAGVAPFGEFLIHGLPGTGFWMQSQVQTAGFQTGDSPPAGFCAVALIAAGGTISITFYNRDITSQDMGASQIRVQRLFST